MSSKHDKKEGTWVVTKGDQVIIEASELKALRTAVAIGGKAKFVQNGHAVNETDPTVDGGACESDEDSPV